MRRFDWHGDWHYFRLFADVGVSMLCDPQALTDFARRSGTATTAGRLLVLVAWDRG